MKNYKISVIKGDGIGPEIVDEAIKVLNAVSKKYAVADRTKLLTIYSSLPDFRAFPSGQQKTRTKRK